MSRKVLLQLVLPLIGLSVLFWLLAFAPGDKHHQPALLEMSVILRDGDGNVSAMRKGMEQAAQGSERGAALPDPGGGRQCR